MIYNTQGIVIGSTKFKESSLIVRIYTSRFGMQSYLVNGVRSSKSKGKQALYQSLSLLDMTVYHKPEKDIQRVSEAKFAYSYQSLPFDPLKRAIGLFLTEVLSKVLRDESTNENLFQFLYNSLSLYDHQQEHTLNFHIQLLLKATAFLGFGPNNGEDFQNQLIDAGFAVSLSSNESEIIDQLIEKSFIDHVPITNADRRIILDHLLKFYSIHTGNLGEIKSLEVLKTVLSA